MRMVERLLKNDKRPRLKKYFRYFLGRLYLAEGKDDQAIDYFNQVLRDPERDDPYQTLLMARAYEGLAMASSGNDVDRYTHQMYSLYPQLLPFADLTMNFRLSVKGDDVPGAENILDDLKDTRINFSNSGNAPQVTLSFKRTGDALDIEYRVETNVRVLQSGTMSVDPADMDNAGKILAYKLFGIQKAAIGEKLPAVRQEIKPLQKPGDNQVSAL